MKVSDWAKREVEIACKRESIKEADDYGYAVACYKSALRALRSLCKDGHSGFSIQATKRILNRLIDGKPLTPVEDSDNVWNECAWASKSVKKLYQCKRMSSLFKEIKSDGSVYYDDTNRVVCIDIDTGASYYNGFIRGLINEMYPITMPYFPCDKSINVYCTDCLTDPHNGDFDTMGVIYLVAPDGEKKSIDRYFKETEKGWTEISKEEYVQRVAKAEKLIPTVVSNEEQE